MPVSETKAFGGSCNTIQVAAIDSDINVSGNSSGVVISRANLEKYGQSSDHAIFDSCAR